MLLPLEVGQRIDRDQILRKLVEIQYERNDTEFGRGTFRVRGDIVEVVPSYEEHALRIGLFGDEVDELAWFDALTGKVIRRLDKIAVYPKTHFVTSRDRTKLAVGTIKQELEWFRGQLESEGQAPRGAAPSSADDVRPRDDQGDRLLPRDRELRAPPDRAHARRAAADAARLPARGRAGDRRREPPDRAAGPRHVCRRPLAQGSPGRVRLPAAVGARQPAAELRGVGGAGAPGGVRLRDARALRAREGGRRRRGAGDSADRADGSADRSAAGPRTGGRPAEGDSRPRRAQGSACW